MSLGRLLFEDMPDGTISFRADFQGGLEFKSHAHIMMRQVIAWLDDQAMSKTSVEVLDTDASMLIPMPMNGHGRA